MPKARILYYMIYDLFIYNPFFWILYFFIGVIVWTWISDKKNEKK